jgi:ribosomal protein S8
MHTTYACIAFGKSFLFQLSTSKGLLTDRAARLSKIGGEILLTIW